jgi:prepilin-type N-terminal cleavage/methylation domain-containing protein
MIRERRGYSLVELIIVVIFVAIFAAVAVPRINFAKLSSQKADTFCRKLVTDLRRTRMMAISDAATNNKGFSLEMLGSEPYSGYRIVNLDTMAVVEQHDIDSTLKVTGGDEFEFSPMGNQDGGDNSIIVTGSSRSYTITTISATGTVKWVLN